jgi:Ca2+-transporting ATPase
MLLTTVSISFFVQLGLIYLPFMQPVFQTEALGFTDLFKLLVLGIAALAMHEGRRRYERQKEREGVWDRAQSLA